VGPDGGHDDHDGGVVHADALGGLLWDAGHLPRQDAGSRPVPDAGPPGDGAGDVWDGYCEATTFASGSDRVHIVLDSPSGSGARTGVLVLGDASLPAVPIDPSVGYAPRGAHFGEIVEGFAYHFVDGAVSDTRVRFTIDPREPWQAWCETQIPVAVTPGSSSYVCVPGVMGYSDGRDFCEYLDPYDMEWTEVDCLRQAMCELGGACSCDASGCLPRPAGSLVSDFHVTGSDGMGTIAGCGSVAHVTRE
jgi:hypothetical protein